MKLITMVAALFCTGFAAHAGTGDSCVTDMNYPTKRAAPSAEAWATDDPSVAGTPESECKMVRTLVQQFTTLQANIARENNGRPLRGTHSKGLCANGELKVQLDPSLTPRQVEILQQAGLFKAGNEAPMAGQFRFANAASTIQPDWVADVRALSMKINLPDGSRQDFAFNNVPRFEIDSVDHFVRTMEMVLAMKDGSISVNADKSPSKGSLVWYFGTHYNPLAAGRYLLALANIGKMKSEDEKYLASYTNQTYWSTTAFALGSDTRASGSDLRIVKFGAAPCVKREGPVTLASEAEAKAVANGSENYLSEALTAQMATAPVCYNLFVQFLNEDTAVSNRTSAVEDPSLIWNSPAHLVAQIKIKDPVDARDCDDPKQAVDVNTNNSGIHGLGQINRARAYVEAASWKNR